MAVILDTFFFPQQTLKVLYQVLRETLSSILVWLVSKDKVLVN